MPDLVPTHERRDNPDVAHEPSEINLRGILWAAGILIGSGVVIHVVVWLHFLRLDDQEAETKKSPFPLAAAIRDQAPGSKKSELGFEQPALEGNQQLRQGGPIYIPSEGLRSARMKAPTTYGPAGEGATHIPIERAMKLLMEDPRLRHKYFPSAADIQQGAKP